MQGELWRLKDSNGNPHGLIDIMLENAVTFIYNHNTSSTQNLWPFPSNKIMKGYAYIFTHPGIPSIVNFAQSSLFHFIFALHNEITVATIFDPLEYFLFYGVVVRSLL